jgi:putative hemolysin
MKQLALLILIILLAACAAVRAIPAPASGAARTPEPNLPNPASVYCEDQGYKNEIRTAEDGSQSGFCIFPDGSECDEWAFYRGECKPGGSSATTPAPAAGTGPAPTEFPTPFPVDPAEYQQGWWTYTSATYGFSIMIPEDWIVDEVTVSDPLMNGHTLTLRPSYASDRENIRMTFRQAGEDTPLWPTGVGQGLFVPNGTLVVAGQPARRVMLVCPGGEVTAIWYHQADGQPNIARGGLEFGFIYSAGGHCEAGQSLVGKLQREGEMIIASLKVP